MLQFPKKQKIRQTVKLTLYHRPKPKSVDMTCSASSIERTKPPAYLFRYQICQRARDKNQTSAPYHLRRARPTLPQIFSKPTNVAAARSVPPCASAPPVKGYLRPQTNTRNPFFIKILKKMRCPAKSPYFLGFVIERKTKKPAEWRAWLGFWGESPGIILQQWPLPDAFAPV